MSKFSWNIEWCRFTDGRPAIGLDCMIKLITALTQEGAPVSHLLRELQTLDLELATGIGQNGQEIIEPPVTP